MLEFLLLATAALPVAWMLSEVQKRRWVSVLLGIGAIAACSFASYQAGRVPLVFQLNATFTGASGQLIDTVVSQLERGNSEQVLTELKLLQPSVHENYEDHPRYTELVAEFVARLDEIERSPASSYPPGS